MIEKNELAAVGQELLSVLLVSTHLNGKECSSNTTMWTGRVIQEKKGG